MKTIQIKVQTRFEFEHCWPDAPDGVAFLRNLHRHEFHVCVVMEVDHDDRELEFILVKRDLDNQIEDSKQLWPTSASCEQMAFWIGGYLLGKYGERHITVEVSEDGENGAIVSF